MCTKYRPETWCRVIVTTATNFTWFSQTLGKRRSKEERRAFSTPGSPSMLRAGCGTAAECSVRTLTSSWLDDYRQGQAGHGDGETKVAILAKDPRVMDATRLSRQGHKPNADG